MTRRVEGGIERIKVLRHDGVRLSRITDRIIRETMVDIVVNGRKIVSVACAGNHLDELAAGFLRSEGLVGKREDILGLAVPPGGGRVEVRLRRIKTPSAERRGRTLGSSGARGMSPYDAPPAGARGRRPGGIVLKTPGVLRLMRMLLRAGRLHEETRGTHCSALATAGRLLAVREDIGRHNTLDMLGGFALLAGMDLSDKAVLTTGRISAEIVVKVRRMGAPVVISHSAPTSRAIELARVTGMTLIGYVRNGRMKIYSGEDRVQA